MANRRAHSYPVPLIDQKPERGKCVQIICFLWKVLTCVVSHVTLVLLVVAYCVCGAYIFQKLEKPYEIEVKKGIRNIRMNLMDRVWEFSDNVSVLSENDWITIVRKDLSSFEKQILTAMKSDGWDGDEDITKSQWTFAGSLFYSIIVITTIGYGHISPHTDWGKITTIFYAIIGIPLMLLCLSNIGDIMATSFRFLYWRVCCYLCTRAARRPPRPLRGHHYISRSQPPPSRRGRYVPNASDYHGYDMPVLAHAYSDPELQRNERSGPDNILLRPISSLGPYNQRNRISYSNDPYNEAITNSKLQYNHHQCHKYRSDNGGSLKQCREKHNSMEGMKVPTGFIKGSANAIVERDPGTRRFGRAHQSREADRFLSRSLPRSRSTPKRTWDRAKSLDTRTLPHSLDNNIEDDFRHKMPVISNPYAINDFELNNQINLSKNTTNRHSVTHPKNNKMKYPLAEQYSTSRTNLRKSTSLHQSHQCSTDRFLNEKEFIQSSSRYDSTLLVPDRNVYYNNVPSTHQSINDGEFQEDIIADRDANFPDRCMGYPRHREYRTKQERPVRLPPSPRIMSPMGLAVKRQIKRPVNAEYYSDPKYDDDWNDDCSEENIPKERPVPIWLCVFLVISYILGGAGLFAYWEEWSFLDSAYFCFITLTTIGFGDFVPAKGVKDESEQSIAYCSLYLLFGIALLAMSFNLVQEEFIANVKEIAHRLGILKDDNDDYE